MTRMEAIRKQYQGSEAAQPQQATCGQPYPARPRHRFWLWFWGAFLFLLIVGFLFGRQPIMEKAREVCGSGTGSSAPAAAVAAHQGATAPAHQGATAQAPQVAAAPAPQEAANPAHQGAAPATQVSDEAFLAYVNPTMAEMSQLCEYIRNAPNVKNNPLYAGIMGNVQFVFQDDNDVVNAYAGLQDAANGQKIPVIIYLAGAARFGRVAALAVAAELSGDKGAGKRFVAAVRPRDFTGFSNAVAARIVREAGLVPALATESVVTKAKSVSAGLMLGILAHEAGHQALGHVLDQSQTVNLEISRNQEREADSFASSVIASSPFGEYILVGTLFWHYALAQQENDQTVATTHPLSKERFENFVRANAELAASMGITVDTGKAK